MPKIVVSAPGKIIVHGEHAVVYGKAAVAATLDLRCKLTLTSDADLLKLDLPDISVYYEWSAEDIRQQLGHIEHAGSLSDPVPASENAINEIKKFLGHHIDKNDAPNLAVIAFLYIYSSLFHEKSSYPSISVLMESAIPVGAGLGSSAAFSVSLVAALLEFSGCIKSEKNDTSSTSCWSQQDRDIINKWAFIGEKVMHGRPSGIDNSVSTYGGALKFCGGKISHIEKMPTLNAILVNTNVPRSTLTLVENFRLRYNKHKEIFTPVLESVEAITEKSVQVLRRLYDQPSKEDFNTLEELVDFNQRLLGLMGVSHPTLEKIVSCAANCNLKAKLTGAGGGGCAFILVPDDTKPEVLSSLTKELELSAFKVWNNISIGGNGVTRHL